MAADLEKVLRDEILADAIASGRISLTIAVCERPTLPPLPPVPLPLEPGTATSDSEKKVQCNTCKKWFVSYSAQMTHNGKRMCFQEMPIPSQPSEGQRLADFIAAKNKLRQIGTSWSSSDSSDAQNMIAESLSKTMAYRQRVLDEGEADGVARSVVEHIERLHREEVDKASKPLEDKPDPDFAADDFDMAQYEREQAELVRLYPLLAY